MRLCFKKVQITSTEIATYIKNHGGLLNVKEPSVYIPVIEENNYHYFEEESEVSHNIISPVICGINKNNYEYLPNSIFIFINDNSTNAIATEIMKTPIIGIYIGSMADVQHNANLIIGTLFERENFRASLFKRLKISINDDEHLIVTSEDSLLGYKDERILSYMVSEAALRFLVLHEIGHHVKGHISELVKNNNFVLLKANDKINSEFELEADSYAASKLAKEYEMLLSELEKHKNDLEQSSSNELRLLTLSIIILAMTLPFSILYQPDDSELIEKDITYTIAYRELNAIMMLTAELYKNEKCKQAVIWDIINKYSGEPQRVLNEIDIKRMKTEKDIKFSEFLAYTREIFINSKHLYYHVNNISNIKFYLENYIKVYDILKDDHI